MARSSNPPLVGHSVHGLDRQTALQLHQQALEKTIQSTLTMIDNDDSDSTGRRNFHNKKKKKYYPWIQRDSLARRNRIGNPGSRRRQRHDNDKFVDHPCAVLYHVDLAFPGHGHDAPSFHWKYDAVMDSLLARSSQHPPRRVSSLFDDEQAAWERIVAQRQERERRSAGHHRLTRAQRKDIKKAHVPQGVVRRYEGELVDFLDQLPIIPPTPSEETATSDVESLSDIVGERLLRQVQQEDAATGTCSGDAVEAQAQSLSSVKTTTATPSLADTAALSAPTLTESSSARVYLRWEIQDRFLRFVAHALCSFYGMVSFTKTCTEGKQWMYVCHPEHLDSLSKATAVSLPTAMASPHPHHQTTDEDSLVSTLSKLSLSSSASSPSSKTRRIGGASGHRQLRSLDLIENMSLTELDRLWPTVADCKVESCLAPPETTFFEYLFPTSRLNF